MHANCFARKANTFSNLLNQTQNQRPYRNAASGCCAVPWAVVGVAALVFVPVLVVVDYVFETVWIPLVEANELKDDIIGPILTKCLRDAVSWLILLGV